MKNLISRNINGKKVLLFFILTNIIYLIMLAISIPHVMNFSNGMKLLDMMPMGYDAEYVDILFNTLGESGRDAYLFIQIPFDMAYPFLFGISYCLILAYFFNKLNKLKSPLIYLCFLPIIAGISDYFENIGIITLLTNYPDYSNSVIVITNFFSVLKSSATTIYFVVLLITIFIFIIKAIGGKKITANSK